MAYLIFTIESRFLFFFLSTHCDVYKKTERKEINNN